MGLDEIFAGPYVPSYDDMMRTPRQRLAATSAGVAARKRFLIESARRTNGDPTSYRVIKRARTTGEHYGIADPMSRHNVPIFDKQLLANQGPQNLTALSMRIGSRVGKTDGVHRFLRNLQQNGRVSCAWNGTMNTHKIDFRTVHMEVFRHRYSSISDNVNDPTNFNLVQGSYPISSGGSSPTQILPQILYPANYASSAPNVLAVPNITNPATPAGLLPLPFNYQEAPATGDVIHNAFIQHVPGSVAFVPLNRPDLEDMSWNLNKMKLSPLAFTGANNDDSIQYFDTNVQLYNINKHRRQSVIQQNNHFAVLASSLSATDAVPGTDPTYTSQLSHYEFEAVLKYGKISYEFMNKEDTGCTVEVICYRVKKTASLSARSDVYTGTPVTFTGPTVPPPPSGGTNNVKVMYPLSMLVNSIGQGYLNTVGDSYSTENFQGRTPFGIDIFNNPNFPLFPKLKKTLESDNPFSEIMRNKFVMTAGSRRTLDVHLPGVVYDPNSIKHLVQTVDPAIPVATDPDNSLQIGGQLLSIMDEYSYAIVLSVNGQKMTRFFDSLPASVNSTAFRGSMGMFDTAAKFFVSPTLAAPNGELLYVAGESVTIFLASPDGSSQAEFVSNNVCDAQSGTPGTDYPTGFSLALAPYTSWNLVSSGPGFVEQRVYVPHVTSIIGVPLSGMQAMGGSSTFDDCIPGFNLTSIVNIAANIPHELPMGDNYGIGHVDYTATYTEHLGACMYKDVKERHLYDCGIPNVPYLVPSGTLPKSVTSSRMILPASTVVRQAKRATFTVDGLGLPVDVGTQAETTGN